MPRTKCLKYNDEQLRILLCIAGFGPLPQKELSSATGIKKGNLSVAVNVLLDQKALVRKDDQKTRQPGRPREYLGLKSPCFIQDILDVLEYRKSQYEIKMKELDASIGGWWVEWADIANDCSKRQEFLDKYGELMRERINLGAEDGSFSSKAHWADAEGKHIIAIRNYDGTGYALKEISYQGIIVRH